LIRVVLWLGALGSLGACVLTPAHETDVAATNEVYEFTGYLPSPGTATVQAREYTENCHDKLHCECTRGPWRDIATVTTSVEGQVADQCGQTWHRYSKPIALPNNTKHWCFSAISRWYTQELRLVFGATTLYSFTNNHNCTPSRACGMDMMSECGNSNGIIRMRCGLHPPGLCTATFQ
jgi:hypothetical protein